jgi:predicted DNA-binding WGR domain protein
MACIAADTAPFITRMNHSRPIDSKKSLDFRARAGEDSAMSQQPPFQTYMQRIEPEHNMRRFYHLSIQQNLFGEVSLMRNWGRIGSAGQVKIQTFAGEDDAHARFTQLFRAKCRRGYRALD